MRYLERVEDGWLVHYQPVGKGRETFDAPTLFVKADIVMLAAGTLGSTEILLRSREHGLSLSPQLGMNFSGNGDILGFGYNCDEEINGIGFGAHEPGEIPAVGACITGVIDMRTGDDRNKRMVIEEGSVPGAIGRLIPSMMAVTSALEGDDTDTGLVDRAKEKLREAESLLRGPYRGAVHNMQTYLIMSHDDGQGRLELQNDRVRIVWPGVGEQANFLKGNDNLYQATKALGGEYVKNPVWTKLLEHSVVTVHPLGGCVMGEDASQGVVSHKGQVFSGTDGENIHTGLYVSDGAVIPTSLAVNPLLTISAVTERCCMLMADDYGWTIDYTLPSKPTRDPEPRTLGLRFAETMRGYFSTSAGRTDAIDLFDEAARAGKAADSRMEFTVDIVAADLDRLLDTPTHNAEIVGTLTASALSDQPLTVTDGTFNLFEVYPEAPDTRHMTYKMRLSSEKGKTYWFWGYKVVHDDPDAFQIWHDTSTLYVTVHEGDSDQGPVVGKGVLHIEPADFARQMTTMAVTNAESPAERLRALARFGEYFGGVLWQTYGGVFASPTVFNPDAPPRKRRPLRVDPPTVHFFTTEDGVTLRLTRYQGGDKGPVMLVHGLGVASSIFSTDTIDTNMLEYLFGQGYDVWLLDFRVSIDLPASAQQSTGDQVATYDYPAAIAKVKEVSGARTVQCVVHCYGASTFFMSMLAGLQDVRSIVCSQIATNIVVPTATRIKTGLHVPSFLDQLGISSLTAYVDSTADWKERLYDKALGLYALSEAQGWCDSPVCHRITFMYAPLYRHATLNNLLHERLHELFGIGNMQTFEHLAVLCRRGVAVSFDGQDVYMPHIDRLQLPICFIHGAQNECYLPESTELTFDLLREKFGDERYSRQVIPGYGHIDCIFGKNAVNDVYPYVLAHLEQTATGN